MWWLLVTICFGVWAILDAKKRRQDSLLLPVLTFAFGTIVLPIYIAKRNLKEGEVREGGLAWNILKNFALFWTITMAVCAISGLFSVAGIETSDEFEEAGVAIGAGIGMMMIAFTWFAGAISALILGMFLKKSSIIEKGPTGALAKLGEADYKISDIAHDVSATTKKGIDKAKEIKEKGKLDPNKIANEIPKVRAPTNR